MHIKIRLEILKGIDHSDDLDVHGRMLKWIIGK
jgi:hypothetical protein